MNITPVTPTDCFALKQSLEVPPLIIEVINGLIAINFEGDHSTVFVKEIIDEVCKRDPSLTEDEIYENNYLDVEDLYVKYGWKKVKYFPELPIDDCEPCLAFIAYD